MLKEQYEQKELDAISAVSALEDDLQNLYDWNKRAKSFFEKVNSALNAPKKTIKKKVTTSPAYQNISNSIAQSEREIGNCEASIVALYDRIIAAKSADELNGIISDAESNEASIVQVSNEARKAYSDLRSQLTPAEMVSLEDNPRNLPLNKRLARVKYSTSENFVTKPGLKLRAIFLGVMQKALIASSRRKTVVEEYHPEWLEGKTPEEVDRTDTLIEVKKVRGLQDDAYVFVPNHLFDEESNSLSISLDRTAFFLVGSTDQIDHNPVLNFLWLSGIAYVNRQDSESRKDSVRKMEKLLNNNTSVVEYIEGRYNNTENKLSEEMFYSAYELWERTGKSVVPVSTHTTMDADTVYICFGKPLDFTGLNKYEARDLVREKVSEMHYEQIRQHSIPLTRAYLDSREDYHFDYMIQRRQEYCHHPWYDDVWDEELTGFIRKDVTLPEEVRASLDNVKLTVNNAHIFAPILLRREQDKKYDFKQFMKDTYDKDIRKLYPDNDILSYEYQKSSDKASKKKRSK